MKTTKTAKTVKPDTFFGIEFVDSVPEKIRVVKTPTISDDEIRFLDKIAERLAAVDRKQWVIFPFPEKSVKGFFTRVIPKGEHAGEFGFNLGELRKKAYSHIENIIVDHTVRNGVKYVLIKPLDDEGKVIMPSSPDQETLPESE